MKNELTVDRNGYLFSTRTNKYKKQHFNTFEELSEFVYLFIHSTILYKTELYVINPKPTQFNKKNVFPSDIICKDMSAKLSNCTQEDFSLLLKGCLSRSIINILAGIDENDMKRIGFLLTPRTLKNPIIQFVYTGDVTAEEYNTKVF